MSDSLIPISDEQAKLGQEALKAFQGLGGYMKETFGTMPQDIVALLGGDYLKVRRAENLFRMIEKAKKRLEDNHVTDPDAPPSLAIPIMIAAADESRDELQDMWAALLAAAADPKRSASFRLKFIEVVKQLDPLDPAVLIELTHQKLADFEALNKISSKLHYLDDEVAVSLSNLESLALVARAGPQNSANYRYLSATALGRELLRAVEPNRTKG
jgi:hypothetical protein